MTLIPANSSSQELLFEDLILQKLDFPLEKLTILPDRAPEAILPHLAWMLGLEIRGPSPAETRALLAKSLELHRYRGTPWALREVLKSVYAGDLDLVEWFEVPGKRPFTFDVTLGISAQVEEVLTRAKVQMLREVVQKVKNARSHLEHFLLRPPPVLHQVFFDGAVSLRLRLIVEGE